MTYTAGGIFPPGLWAMPVSNVITPADPVNWDIRMGLPAGSGAGSAASAGTISLQTDARITARNNVDTLDLNVLTLNANRIELGGVVGGGTRPSQCIADVSSAINNEINGASRWLIQGATITGNPTASYDLQVNSVSQVSIDTNGLHALRSWRREHLDIDDSDSPYTIVEGYSLLLVDCSAGAVTVNLPAVATSTDRTIVIKDWSGNAAANPITVNPQAGEQLDNGGAGVGLNINVNNDTMTVYCDGVTWGTI